MARAWKTCSTPNCPELVPAGTPRCEPCMQAAEQRRGTATQRGYGHTHRTRFRRGVLLKNPLCVCTNQTRTPTHHHGPQCLAPSTVADHHPRSRRELVAAGLDADDPQHGRGLCKVCHDHHTAMAQPGGWHAR